MAGTPRQTVLPRLECGIYKASGTVLRNSQGHYLLTMNPTSSSPTEFVLLGGDFEAKLDSVHSRTAVEFYVPATIADNSAPYVFLQKFTAHPATTDDGVELVKKHRCGDQGRYVASK